MMGADGGSPTPQKAARPSAIGGIDVHLLASALVARLSSGPLIRHWATVAKQLGITYELVVL
jgi:hypothetical protein